MMRAELLELLNKLTKVVDIQGLKCWYGIPLEEVPIGLNDVADTVKLKESLNKIKKQAIKEKRNEFVKYLIDARKEFEKQVYRLYDMEIITQLFDEQDTLETEKIGFNDFLFTELFSSEEQKDPIQQYFEFTDRPHKQQQLRNPEDLIFDSCSLGITDKPTFNFLMGVFHNFVVNDPQIRVFLEYLLEQYSKDQADDGGYLELLQCLIRLHKDYMLENQTQFMVEIKRIINEDQIFLHKDKAKQLHLLPQSGCVSMHQYTFNYCSYFFINFYKHMFAGCSCSHHNFHSEKFQRMFELEYQQSLFNHNFYLCDHCFSHSFKKIQIKSDYSSTTSIPDYVQLIDHFDFGDRDPAAKYFESLPKEMKQTI